MPAPFIRKIVGTFSQKDTTLKAHILRGILNSKASSIYKRISRFLDGKILDVGVGAGGIYSYIKNSGHEIEGIDVKDVSYIEEAHPIIYDGQTFPYKDNEFGTAIIIQVLHHCENNIQVLKEALRVSHRVIVIEDTYRNNLEKALVSLNDNIGNFEFYQHKYYTPDKWKEIIKNLGARLIYMEEYSELTYVYTYGRYVLFVIEKK